MFFAPHTTRLTLACLATAGLLHAQSGRAKPSPASHGHEAARSKEERLHAIGIEAYVYAYPMVLMEITRRVSTSVPEAEGMAAPMNHLAHARTFPDAAFRDVVRPNADTLYSTLWFDVREEPLVLSLPEIDRYCLFPLLDMWTDVFAVPGTRATGTAAADYAIVGPRWHGQLPQGLEPVRSPTGVGWMIGRIETKGPADYENVHRLQDAMKVVPLSRWGREDGMRAAAAPVESSVDRRTPPPVQVANMDAERFFTLFAELLKDNPPHECDWSTVARLREIGIVPSRSFDWKALGEDARTQLARAVADAPARIAAQARLGGEKRNGWKIGISGLGTYGTAYVQRAAIARLGLGANPPEDAVYPMTDVDSKGEPLVGSRAYELRFPQGKLPPVDGFWSLTMYDGEGYFVANPIDRYALGNRDALVKEPDGSLRILIQHEDPGGALRANWLPAPKEGFNLVLRLYWPRTEILLLDWLPPPVERTGGR